MALSTLAALKTAIGIPATNTAKDAQLTALLAAADAAAKTYTGQGLESTSYPGQVAGTVGDAGFYSGNGRRGLILRQGPVTAVSAVYLDAAGYGGQNTANGYTPFAANTQLTQGSDWIIEYDGSIGGSPASFCAILKRVGGSGGSGDNFGWYPQHGALPGSLTQPGRYPVWPVGSLNIKVQYTAGFPANAIPADLVQAVHELAAWLFKVAAHGGFPVQSESLADYSYSLAVNSLQGRPELGSIRQLLARYRRIAV